MGVIVVGGGGSVPVGPTVQLTDVEYSLYPIALSNVEYGD